MRPYDDETLMRRVDGELEAEVAARLDADAVADPALAARLQAMRQLGAAAREAFPLDTDPRDAVLARHIASARPSRSARAAVWAGLLAASFVGGIVAGPLLRGHADGVGVAADGAVADAGLVRVLDRRLASEGPDASGRAVGLTFRDTSGRWCRTFVAGEAGMAGLACREADGWAMETLARAGPSGGEVRTAAAALPVEVLSAVDARLSGQTLDAAAEARARDSGWLPPNVGNAPALSIR